MSQKLFLAGVLVFLVGFVLIAAGSLGQGNASVGGVVFIGPVPIVFGSGPGGLVLALGSLLIGAVMVALLLLWAVQFRRMKAD